MLNWNIKCGGFTSYDSNLVIPSREQGIKSLISNQHQFNNVEAVTLTDTYRWDELYGDENAIASHLGFQNARYTRLEDPRLEETEGAAISITFATDKKIEKTTKLDLGNRVDLGIILDIGKHGLQIANVYLDDLSEDKRISQIRALETAIEKDIPTLLIGDFNALRYDMKNSSLEIKLRDLAVPSLSHIIPAKSGLSITASEMNRRLAIPLLESLGYTDSDKDKKRPTAPSRLPLYGVDYVFHNDNVSIDEFEVLPIYKQSDHRPLVFKALISD